jgi:hypothetical protein
MNRFLHRLVDDEIIGIAKLVYTTRLSGRYVELAVTQSEFINTDPSWPAFWWSSCLLETISSKCAANVYIDMAMLEFHVQISGF